MEVPARLIAIEEHHEVSRLAALAAPVVAAIGVAPPVAGEALGTDGTVDGDAAAAPAHRARYGGRVGRALHVYRLGGLEQPQRTLGGGWRRGRLLRHVLRLHPRAGALQPVL